MEAESTEESGCLEKGGQSEVLAGSRSKGTSRAGGSDQNCESESGGDHGHERASVHEAETGARWVEELVFRVDRYVCSRLHAGRQGHTCSGAIGANTQECS